MNRGAVKSLASALLVLTLCGSLVSCAASDQSVQISSPTPSATEAPSPTESPSAIASAAPTDPDDISLWVIGYGTLGPLETGMSMADMAGIMDVPIDEDHWINAGDCAQGALTGVDDAVYVEFLADSAGSYGPIDMFSISTSDTAGSSSPRTAGGNGVGSTEANVRAEFGSAMSERPKYYEQAGKLLVASGTDDLGIVFVTDETSHVTGVITGRFPQILYPEGCA